jgi:hypothetical protein
VIQLLLDNPFGFLEALYGRVYITGNILWAIILFAILNATNLDGSLLAWLGLLEERKWNGMHHTLESMTGRNPNEDGDGNATTVVWTSQRMSCKRWVLPSISKVRRFSLFPCYSTSNQENPTTTQPMRSSPL